MDVHYVRGHRSWGLKGLPLLSWDKLRWPWLFETSGKDGDPSNVSQQREKCQRGIFFPSSSSLTRAVRNVFLVKFHRTYPLYLKEHFTQSGVFDILVWNFIASISISSCLYLSVAWPGPHIHTQILMGAASVRWKGWKGTRYSGSSLPH